MYNGSILNSKKFKRSFIYAFFLMLAAFPFSGFSQENGAGAAQKEPDTKDIIFEHIGDSHSFASYR